MSSSKVSKNSNVSTAENVKTEKNKKTKNNSTKPEATQQTQQAQPESTQAAQAAAQPDTTQPSQLTQSTKSTKRTKSTKTTQPETTQPETTQTAAQEQPVAQDSHAAQEPEQEQTQEKNKRHFKGLFLLGDGSVVQYGRYSGPKPKAAGNKACTKYYKLREHAMNKQPKVFKSPELHSSKTWTELYTKFLGQPLPDSVVFALQECTRNENTGKKFYYTGSRTDISDEKRKERRDKAEQEKKSVFIDYKHENKVRKLKVGENEEAFLTLATNGLNEHDKQRVVKRRERLTAKHARTSGAQQQAASASASASAPTQTQAQTQTQTQTQAQTQAQDTTVNTESTKKTKKAKKTTDEIVAAPETVVVKKSSKTSTKTDATVDTKKTKKTKTT